MMNNGDILTLLKMNNISLYDNDLDEITELDLNCIDLVGEKNDVTIEDIVFFKNLKSLYLSNFSISVSTSVANQNKSEQNQNKKISAKLPLIKDKTNIIFS